MLSSAVAQMLLTADTDDAVNSIYPKIVDTLAIKQACLARVPAPMGCSSIQHPARTRTAAPDSFTITAGNSSSSLITITSYSPTGVC